MTEKAYVPFWAKGVTPQEWRQRLLTLASPAREAAARIIWWETISLRLMGDRCDLLDDMLRFGPEVPDEDLRNALVQIGMPRKTAERRITTPKPRPPRRKQSPQ